MSWFENQLRSCHAHEELIAVDIIEQPISSSRLSGPAMASDASIGDQESHISDDRLPILLAVFILCLIISYAAVLLRFVSRRLGKNSLKTDDWMAFASLVCVGVTCTFGFSHRAVYIPADDMPPNSFQPRRLQVSIFS